MTIKLRKMLLRRLCRLIVSGKCSEGHLRNIAHYILREKLWEANTLIKNYED